MSQRSIDLALKGVGQVSPGPLVGCVIVAENGKVVGEGFYKYETVIHAEVLALKQAGKKAFNGTAYVSLEPHSYKGRTKPCTDALINAGIRRVVCPIEDPNPQVSGKGFNILKENGVEVVTGILKHEAEIVNEQFIQWHRFDRPFIHLKMAMSLDGRISLNDNVSTAISGAESARRVQQFRHKSDAILIGGNTAFTDNPNLTDRSGLIRRRKLVRVVLDNRLQISATSKLATTTNVSPTLVISNSNESNKIKLLEANGVEVISMDARNLQGVLEVLRNRNLQSVLVEGGSEVAGSFVDAKLVDKVTFIKAPFLIGGKTAPFTIGGNGAVNLKETLFLENIEVHRHNNDIEITGYPKRNE